MCIGYDKLKPYGFPVHGAIDGYSRKILWLELSRSNNKPEIPARYYLDSVKKDMGCPTLLRTDCGTENGVMAAMQCSFRQDGIDEFSSEKAHKYGSSPANQQIEGWWSFFRRGRAGLWIDFFKDMAESGLLDIGNTLHMECLWFCFEPVLPPRGGVLPYITYTGMCRPTGSWFWSSWFRTGYPFQRRFLERGILFRTHESSRSPGRHTPTQKNPSALPGCFARWAGQS